MSPQAGPSSHSPDAARRLAAGVGGRRVDAISAINRAGGIRGDCRVGGSTAAAVIVAARGGGTGHDKE